MDKSGVCLGHLRYQDVTTMNSITSKTWPTFGSPREMWLIHNREMFLQGCEGLESTPRRVSQEEEVALFIFMHIESVCGGAAGVMSGRCVGGDLCTDLKRPKPHLWPVLRSGWWTLSPASPPLCGSWKLSPERTVRSPGAHTSLSNLQMNTKRHAAVSTRKPKGWL